MRVNDYRPRRYHNTHDYVHEHKTHLIIYKIITYYHGFMEHYRTFQLVNVIHSYEVMLTCMYNTGIVVTVS